MKINEIEYLNQVRPNGSLDITASYDLRQATEKGGVDGMIIGIGATHEEAKKNLLGVVEHLREELLCLLEATSI